jgi:hypothetical protein
MEAVGQVMAERAGRLAFQQLGCRGPVQARQPEPGHVGPVEQGRLALPDGQDHGHRLGHEAAEREEQGIRAGPVEPVRVVHEHRDRGLVGVGRQQAEGRRADREPVLVAGGHQRERAPQRVGLWSGDPVDPGERRTQQLEKYEARI